MLAERLGPADMRDASDLPVLQGLVAVQPGSKDATGGIGAFDADTAHELANLVLVMSGSLEQLRRQPLDEQGQRQLARIEWSVRQATQLTRRVLSLAQGGDGRPEVTDLNAAVGKCAVAMGRDIGEGVQLTAELAQGRLPVRLDAGLLELVLLNLVRVAAGAMPDGGTVMLRTRGPRLDGLGNQLATEVSVSDSGAGMPQDKDTELGLRMAHHFASTYGGKIKVETKPGLGTTVSLSLPYAEDAKPT